MSQPLDAALLRRVTEWAYARDEYLLARRTRDSFRCEETEPYEPETGYPGVPVCYRGNGPTNEWCDSCRAREPYFQQMMQLRRIERNHYRALCGLLDRRAIAARRLLDAELKRRVEEMKA